MDRLPENLWGEKAYISQIEPPYSDIPFGGGTIRKYGCGACATANILLHMGAQIPFADVVSYYAKRGQPLHALGRTFGIAPWQIRAFFNRRGSTASMKLGVRGFRRLLRKCRYVIAVVKWKGSGAHFIACMENGERIDIVDCGNRYGKIRMSFRDIGEYLAQYGGGFVLGAIGIDTQEKKIAL